MACSHNREMVLDNVNSRFLLQVSSDLNFNLRMEKLGRRHSLHPAPTNQHSQRCHAPSLKRPAKVT
eukprot:3964597-Amphidinium_carterae.1